MLDNFPYRCLALMVLSVDSDNEDHELVILTWLVLVELIHMPLLLPTTYLQW